MRTSPPYASEMHSRSGMPVKYGAETLGAVSSVPYRGKSYVPIDNRTPLERASMGRDTGFNSASNRSRSTPSSQPVSARKTSYASSGKPVWKAPRSSTSAQQDQPQRQTSYDMQSARRPSTDFQKTPRGDMTDRGKGPLGTQGSQMRSKSYGTIQPSTSSSRQCMATAYQASHPRVPVISLPESIDKAESPSSSVGYEAQPPSPKKGSSSSRSTLGTAYPHGNTPRTFDFSLKLPLRPSTSGSLGSHRSADPGSHRSEVGSHRSWTEDSYKRSDSITSIDDIVMSDQRRVSLPRPPFPHLQPHGEEGGLLGGIPMPLPLSSAGTNSANSSRRSSRSKIEGLESPHSSLGTPRRSSKLSLGRVTSPTTLTSVRVGYQTPRAGGVTPRAMSSLTPRDYEERSSATNAGKPAVVVSSVRTTPEAPSPEPRDAYRRPDSKTGSVSRDGSEHDNPRTPVESNSPEPSPGDTDDMHASRQPKPSVVVSSVRTTSKPRDFEVVSAPRPGIRSSSPSGRPPLQSRLKCNSATSSTESDSLNASRSSSSSTGISAPVPVPVPVATPGKRRVSVAEGQSSFSSEKNLSFSNTPSSKTQFRSRRGSTLLGEIAVAGNTSKPFGYALDLNGTVYIACPGCEASYATCEPMTLTCQHTFCSECVQGMVEGDMIKCKECKETCLAAVVRKNYAMSGLGSIKISEMRRRNTVTLVESLDICCPVCMENYRTENKPLLMPCGHSVCEECADLILVKDDATMVDCPECRQTGARSTLTANKDLLRTLKGMSEMRRHARNRSDSSLHGITKNGTQSEAPPSNVPRKVVA